MINMERTGNVKLHTAHVEGSIKAWIYNVRSAPYERRKCLVTVNRSDEVS